jgi:hypothetical protein
MNGLLYIKQQREAECAYQQIGFVMEDQVKRGPTSMTMEGAPRLGLLSQKSTHSTLINQ